MSRLFDNWRKRVRGYSRPPIQPVFGGWTVPPADEDSGTDPEASPSRNEGAAGPDEGPGGYVADSASEDATVIPFPANRRAQAAEPPPSRPRGPLAWAYWSERKN